MGVMYTVIMLGIGVVIGMYVTSQIGENINKKTRHKKFLSNMEEFDKRTKK